MLHMTNMNHWEPEFIEKKHNMLPIYILASVFALIGVVSLIVNKGYGYDFAQWEVYITPCFTILDFITDVQLVIGLWDENNSLKTIATAILGTTMIRNYCIL